MEALSPNLISWCGVVCIESSGSLLTQQQADTVICIVLRPPVTTSLRYSGRWTEEDEVALLSEDEDLASPRSMWRGLAFTETCTEPGQFVLMARSSWWKHLNWNKII